MNRSEAKQIMAEAEAAMAAVFAAHNLKGAPVRASFDGGSITLRMKGEGIGDESPRVKDWERYASSYGLPQDALGKLIVVNGKGYRITGLAPSRRKYPITVEEVLTGKDMLLTLQGVKNGLGLTGPER